MPKVGSIGFTHCCERLFLLQSKAYQLFILRNLVILCLCFTTGYFNSSGITWFYNARINNSQKNGHMYTDNRSLLLKH